MPPNSDSSEEEEDIFITGGIPKPARLNLRHPKNKSKTTIIDSSSDDDSDSFLPPGGNPSTKRGRKKAPVKKRERGENIEGGGGMKKGKKDTVKGSVFDASSGDDEADEVQEVQEVLVDDEEKDVRDCLARAERMLDFEGNEERLREEAEKLAREQVEGEERKRELEKRKNEEEEKERERINKAKIAPPIELKVQAKGGLSVKMRIRKTDCLLKMLGPFCEKFGLEKGKAVMMVDGEVVGALDTPESYELEQNMVVEVELRNK